MKEKELFSFENTIGAIILIIIVGFDFFKTPFYNWLFASIFYGVALYIKYYIIDKI